MCCCAGQHPIEANDFRIGLPRLYLVGSYVIDCLTTRDSENDNVSSNTFHSVFCKGRQVAYVD